MIVSILYELKSEIERSYITGIHECTDSPTLLKYVPLIEQHAEEDPAYANLASALKQLIELNLLSDIEALSEIYASLNYLLRLYGKPIFQGKERSVHTPILTIDNIFTTHSFLDLKSLITALTEPGEDRLESIRKARENKLFDDFRTYPYLNMALGSEPISTEVEDIIKNEIGEKMMPFLLKGFRNNDDSGNSRRFSLLCDFQYENMDQLLDRILKGTDVNLQIEAIEYISNDATYEDQIILLSDTGQKPVRGAVYKALARMGTKKTEKKLSETYLKAIKDRNKIELELIIVAMSQLELRYTFDEVFGCLKDILNHMILGNRKVDNDAFIMLRMAISALKQKNRPEVYDFLFDLTFRDDYYAVIRKNEKNFDELAKGVFNTIISVYQELEVEKQTVFYEKVIREMPKSGWKSLFYKAYLTICIENGSSASDLYDRFAPYYDMGQVGVEDLVEIFVEDLSAGVLKKNIEVDRRWIDKLYETLNNIDEVEDVDGLLKLLDALEPAPSKRFDDQLITVGEQTGKYLLEITTMIMKRDSPNKFEIVFSLIKKCHDRRDSSTANMLRLLARASYWEEFPEMYAAKFRTELKNAPRSISVKIEQYKV